MPTPMHPTPKIRSRIHAAVLASQPASRQAGAEVTFLAWLLEGAGWQVETRPEGPALWHSGWRLTPGGAVQEGVQLEGVLSPGDPAEASLPRGLLAAAWDELQRSRERHGNKPLEGEPAQYGELLRQRWRPDGRGYARPPLIQAVLSRDPDELQMLLRHGVDVNMQTPDGETALHFALWNGRMGEASLLLSEGASPYLQNSRGQTPLHVFSRKIVKAPLGTRQQQLLNQILERFEPLVDLDGNLPHHFLLEQSSLENVLPVMNALLDTTPLSCFTQVNHAGRTPLEMLRLGHEESAFYEATAAYQARQQAVVLESAIPVAGEAVSAPAVRTRM